jgi:hypothetical protein
MVNLFELYDDAQTCQRQTICLLVLLAFINQKSLVDIADLGQIPRPVNWFSGEQQSNYSS